ncbi:MAG: 30S ribosomal protein S8 [Clostridia bacterium]|jgi:small subunit ribosomal protein S8|nr:30S ribosomal protein S8 [Clostridia bacterium]
MTDPIADMLTRIRNALIVKHDVVEVPASNMKKEIARLLLQEGYITSYEIVEQEVQDKIVITLKYGPNGEKVINGLKRVSKPGLRIYAGHDELPKVLGGLGVAIISTPKGVMTDKEARKANHGGEVLAYIW